MERTLSAVVFKAKPQNVNFLGKKGRGVKATNGAVPTGRSRLVRPQALLRKAAKN